jgi:Zn finger protein HypA/HybF involved in hydrogenase expression
MAIKTTFQCEDCDSTVTITVKSKEFTSLSDIRNCPVCGSPIPYEEQDDDDD